MQSRPFSNEERRSPDSQIRKGTPSLAFFGYQWTYSSQRLLQGKNSQAKTSSAIGNLCDEGHGISEMNRRNSGIHVLPSRILWYYTLPLVLDQIIVDFEMGERIRKRKRRRIDHSTLKSRWLFMQLYFHLRRDYFLRTLTSDILFVKLPGTLSTYRDVERMYCDERPVPLSPFGNEEWNSEYLHWTRYDCKIHAACSVYCIYLQKREAKWLNWFGVWTSDLQGMYFLILRYEWLFMLRCERNGKSEFGPFSMVSLSDMTLMIHWPVSNQQRYSSWWSWANYSYTTAN